MGESCFFYVPAQSGSVRRRRGRGCCRGVPVHLGAAGPLGWEEWVVVGWAQCWVLSVKHYDVRAACHLTYQKGSQL